MDREIVVIFDCSGSMRELGKGDILGSALRSLPALAGRYPGLRLARWLWNEAMTEFTAGTPLTVHGSADPGVLEEYLRRLSPGTPLLLLSDGLFPAEGAARVVREAGLYLLPVAVGADADQYALKDLSATGRVYAVSDLPGVLDRLCYGPEGVVHEVDT